MPSRSTQSPSGSSSNAVSPPSLLSRKRQPPIDIDAPVKPRKYHGASATSQRPLQKSLEDRLPPDIRSEVRERLYQGQAASQSPSASSPPEEEEEAVAGESMKEKVEAYVEVTRERVERKRYMNMLATRRSRARKAEHIERLEVDVAYWKKRVMDLERQIQQDTAEYQKRIEVADRKRGEVEAEIRRLLKRGDYVGHRVIKQEED